MIRKTSQLVINEKFAGLAITAGRATIAVILYTILWR